ncbi:MAG: DNA primase, partial [bacterium]
MNSDIQTILDSVNITDEISVFVNLKKVGRNYSGLCPFHSEKTPSFNVDNDKGLFYCFGCGKGGNVINFLMDIKGESFVEIITYLREKYSIPVSDDWNKNNFKQYKNSNYYSGINNNSDNSAFSEKAEIKKILKLALNYYYENLFIYKKIGADTLNYLQLRGISKESAKEFKFGYAPFNKGLSKILAENKIQLDIAVNIGLLYKNGNSYADRFINKLIIPIFDQFDEPIAFAARIINSGGKTNNAEDGPKYVNTNNSLVFNKNKTLFGLNKSLNYIKNLNYVIVVEGYFDMISLYNGGIKNIVATMGTALSKNHILALSRLCDNIVLLYDGDEAGLNAINRGLELFKEFMDNSEKNIYAVSLKDDEDPDSFVQKFGGDKLKAYLNCNKKRIIEFVIDYYINKYLMPDNKQIKYKNNTNTIGRQSDKPHEKQSINESGIVPNYELSFNDDMEFNKEIILKKKILIIDNIVPFLNIDNVILFSYYINLIAGKIGLNEKLVREYINNKKMRYNNKYIESFTNYNYNSAANNSINSTGIGFNSINKYPDGSRNNKINYKNDCNDNGNTDNNSISQIIENKKIDKNNESKYDLQGDNFGQDEIGDELDELNKQSYRIEKMILIDIFRNFLLTKFINESILNEFSDKDIVLIIKEIRYLLSNDVSDALNSAENKLIQEGHQILKAKFSNYINIGEVFEKTQNPSKWKKLYYECQFVHSDIDKNLTITSSHLDNNNSSCLGSCLG